MYRGRETLQRPKLLFRALIESSSFQVYNYIQGYQLNFLHTMNQKRGFLPLLIVIFVALVVGGGVYYASKHKKAEVVGEADVNTQVTVSPSPSQASSQGAGAENSGTLRALLSLGRDVQCTIDAGNVSGASSGTVYVSGTMMRGDFTTTTQASGSVQSHMIRNGDDVIVWSGSQGAKMKMNAMTGQSSASAQSSSQVNLDQKVNYTCTDWHKDDAQFQSPVGINIIDVSAMMKAKINVGGIPRY